MIVLTEKTRVHAILFISDMEGLDWLGFVSKQPDEPWQFIYRFRYHVDDKAHDSADRKSWYCVQAVGTERFSESPPEELAKGATFVANAVARRYGGKIHHLPIRGNGIDAANALSKETFVSMRRESTPS
jgi:hypothetical protein